MRVAVLDSNEVPARLNFSIRDALALAPHEIIYVAEDDRNSFALALECDAVVLVDSYPSHLVAILFGWYVRCLPCLIVSDVNSDPALRIAAFENDPRVYFYGESEDQRWADDAPDLPEDDGSLRDFFLRAFIEMEEDKTKFLSFHIRDDGAPGADKGVRDSVFISYSHCDEQYLDELLSHLESSSKALDLKIWSDQQLKEGNDWQAEIARAIDCAAVAILLVSSDFLRSQFILDDELPPLLNAAQAEGVLILPVVVRDCRFKRDPKLRKFHAFNNAEAVGLLSAVERDVVWNNVAERIEDCFEPSRSNPLG